MRLLLIFISPFQKPLGSQDFFNYYSMYTPKILCVFVNFSLRFKQSFCASQLSIPKKQPPKQPPKFGWLFWWFMEIYRIKG